MSVSDSIWLGVDPGIARIGYGVTTQVKGQIKTLGHGCITTEAKNTLPNRLSTLYRELKKIIKLYQPQHMVVEQIFFAKNTKTALTVGHARGVILLAAAEHHLVIHEYTPLQIKQALTGYGQADKKQVGQMVKLILKLPSIPTPDDTADALAIALCGMQTNNLERL